MIRRSASVPSNAFNPNAEEPDENKNPFQHRLLFRTGSSVSDSTKAKLRDDILSGKSAAVWRKPSITELEISIVHHHSDDQEESDDSCGSDVDNDDVMDHSLESLQYPITTHGKRKLSGETPIGGFIQFDHPSSPHHPSSPPVVMTTAT